MSSHPCLQVVEDADPPSTAAASAWLDSLDCHYPAALHMTHLALV